MSVIFEAENYRGLKKVRWAPSGVCALVGPNGAGKTTLLRLAELFKYCVKRGFPEAVELTGGWWGLRHLNAEKDTPVSLRATVYQTTYELRVQTPGTAGFSTFEESVVEGGQRLLFRPFGSDVFTFDGKQYPVEEDRLCLQVAADATSHPAAKMLVAVLSKGQVFRTSEYDIKTISTSGSRVTGSKYLQPSGRNVFSTLRNWRDKLATQDRYRFVVTSLRKAFPGVFSNIEFETVGETITASYTLPLRREPIPFHVAPDGLLVGLLHLCAVAGATGREFIAIDEMEHSLHPHAIRSLLDSIREWSESKPDGYVTVALATHSPVVLDCFRDDKENVFVMEPGQEVQPGRITDLTDPNWLAQFSLGQVYMDGEIGSPVLNEPTPEAA